jgi:DNA-directed RNA polymerase specialized sigma24 family protein
LNPDGSSSGYSSGEHDEPEDWRLPRDKQAILQELLVLRCQRGESRAFDELVRLWEERLFYYIRRLVGTEEDAWDVLQQTWLRVFKGIKTLRDRDRLPVWLYQLARSAVLSHWRGHYRPEKLLEIEYRLAELTEAVKTQRPATPGTDA